MARTVDSAHRDRLVDAAAHDLLEHGLPGATLDRLAAAAGTSARMLVHHFGSRRALIDAALDRARSWEMHHARAALPPGQDFIEVLAGAWDWFGSDEAHRFFRLFGQVAAVGRLGEEEQPSVPRSQLTTEWLNIFADGFAACGCRPAIARRLATSLLAQVRGLLLDLDATGDRSRVERAYRDYVALLATSPHLPKVGTSHRRVR
ncbi:TetR/AcrR family transcriptional regulator [Kibdelosporangium aridum]|uniref:TetR/AcrR family transcriptional regulator n=1 Tax=Kibdelosporangium aridum TaxID=2030 RepID=A0A428ZDV2_KIBAR|nr:TetR/AcrR family transcriptional regulator [Kibdelosporangium aridum]RSM86262.1 TetR/AcrR family transcriptional regulator [Kibdelosporangium aridum]